MVQVNYDLDSINQQADLDFFTAYNRVYIDNEVNDDPYFGVNLSSCYHTSSSLADLCNNEKSPIYLSINIQSLLSKYEQLVLEMAELEEKNIVVDAIAIQETWDVKYTDLVPLHGFNPLIYKRRRGMRGGGVGFYVRNNIHAEILDHLSPFENKIIEALTIRLVYPCKKSVILTSIYRSNGTLANVTASQQMERFQEKFSDLLTGLQALNQTSFVFLDSNINLLNIQQPEVAHYLNSIFEKGYLQIITKATRIQNESKTLIDQILTNSRGLDISSGTLLTDLSDHFFTFVLTGAGRVHKQLHRNIITRDFSNTNLLEFAGALGRTDWTNVTNLNTVDEAFEEFWTVYKSNYNRIFKLKQTRFNKNIHKIQKFMTAGLLISRNSKKALHLQSISDPSAANIQKYKNYKSVYQRVIRGAKKLYFTNKLEENVGNPKKTWATLNEILGKSRKTENIEKINVNGVPSSDPIVIANQFNTFFTEVGRQISDSVPSVAKRPEDYINYGRPVPDLSLQNTTPEFIKKNHKKPETKTEHRCRGGINKNDKINWQ